ncbi:hypothetical protein TELCIR_00352 [Teladorsagia circumcincta]|uniref:Bestrophin homolog n=1 Tax=Teladorsagia circumcincta TaxID=45464 RepID=A0A2G9V4W3_TELCI|nr:hypothetical protein TELCIR_00352 [Teladorsagia circumcincta]
MRVRTRFPTMESMVKAGFLNMDELKELSKIDLAYNRYWTPLHWALGVSFQALEKKYFETPWARICVQNEIETFRTNLALLCNFDWVPVPISYPQTGLCIVDDEYGACPELTPDSFTDPEYNPVYPEDSKHHGDHGVLTGSAENYR